MEALTKKTTILFPPRLHDRLTLLAAKRGTSLGDLVRAACEQVYSVATTEEKLAAAMRIASLKLPVGSVARMKRESVPDPKSLLSDTC